MNFRKFIIYDSLKPNLNQIKYKSFFKNSRRVKPKELLFSNYTIHKNIFDKKLYEKI